jgi:hypothetical protein
VWIREIIERNIAPAIVSAATAPQTLTTLGALTFTFDLFIS